jgi:hypothetical protein
MFHCLFCLFAQLFGLSFLFSWGYKSLCFHCTYHRLCKPWELIDVSLLWAKNR